jgi:two-component system, NarL family, sensor histidine kinase BarA
LLFAIGIITVFLAMVILYVIIHYVVVRPLQHLRDVSEQISRGNTELRAEIQTNDEFEELANAFNRMLRHMTETQAELQSGQHGPGRQSRPVGAAEHAAVRDEPLEERLPGQHEPRTADAAEQHHRLFRGLAGHRCAERQAETLRPQHPKIRPVLLDMINDILDLAKIEAGKMDLRLTEFRIGAVVSSQCDMVRALSEEKNIDLEVDIGANLPMMFQDQGKIQQIC